MVTGIELSFLYLEDTRKNPITSLLGPSLFPVYGCVKGSNDEVEWNDQHTAMSWGWVSLGPW